MTITVLRDGSRRFRFRLAVTRAVVGLHVRRHRLGVDELREVYLVAVFLLAQANWVNGSDDDMWRDVLRPIGAAGLAGALRSKANR